MALVWAGNYIDEINNKLNIITSTLDPKYKYVINENGGRNNIAIEQDQGCIQLVEIEPKYNIFNELINVDVTGYLNLYRSYNLKTLYIDFLVSFTENNVQLTTDAYRKIKELFLNDNDIQKLQWGACVENPIKKTYDKIFKKLSNNPIFFASSYRIYNGMRLYDGKITDQIVYQIMKNPV